MTDTVEAKFIVVS